MYDTVSQYHSLVFLLIQRKYTHITLDILSYNFYIKYSRLMNKKNLSFAKIWNSICPEIRKLGKNTFNKNN